MVSSDKDAAALFGARLREAMLAAGHVSRGARSGVDVARLAEASQTTYEMARRYAEGLAMPRPDKLKAIAQWLGVSPASLAYDAAPADAIDAGKLQQCLEAVTHAQVRTGQTLKTEQAAQLVALLYAEVSAGRMPTAESLDLLVRSQR
ncbi:MAG: hypothetical protein AB7P94_16960 [Steroidobacteraceae bacterium]